MPRRRRHVLVAAGCLLLAAAAAGGYALYAMGSVRPFYAEAIQAPPDELHSAAQRMESRVEQLVAAPKPAGRWETIFTDQEVNGWLATMLREHYTDLLPPEVVDPRVAFREGQCLLGYRYDGRAIDTVISIEGKASLPDEDLAAVRFERAYAGILPLPMSRVVKEISQGAEKLGIPIRWTEVDGAPVLLVSVAGALSTDEERRRLERIELRDGELVLAGSAEPQPPAAGKVAASTPPPTQRQPLTR